MRNKLWYALVLAGVITLLAAGIFGHSPSAGENTPLAGGANLKSLDPNKGIRHFWAERTFGNRPIPKGAYQKALRQWNALPKVATYSGQPPKGQNSHAGASVAKPGTPSKMSPSMLSPITSLHGVTWQPIGPDPIDAGGGVFWNGRVNSIAINPNNANQIYIGTTGGGVWKSNDAGAHWTPLMDHQAMLAIGEPAALAIDPSNTNTIYVGSSTAVNNSTGAQGIALNTTLGVLKSTDGGGSWITLGSGFPAGNNGNASQFANTDIYAIVVDPANSSILYLAGSLGLWTSTDGGENWTRGTNGGVGTAQSLVLDTSSSPGSRVLYAGVNSSGVWKTTDGGATWTQVLSTATSAVAAALTAHTVVNVSGPNIGKVAVTLAPVTGANPGGHPPIYVTIEGNGGDFVPTPYTQILGIFESTDAGGTWTLRNSGSSLQCQCFYTNTIAADPGSPGDGSNDVIYWGGTNEFRSADSGSSFSDVTNGVHADSHAWAFVPQPSPPSIVYSGNDGGIWRSLDSGGSWTGAGGGEPTINAGGLQTTLFYHVDIKRDATASVALGALQDNGTVQWKGSPGWAETFGGDGLIAVFDQINLSTAYNVNDGGPEISTSNGDSGSWSDITNNIPHDPTKNNQVQTFSNTLDVDPNNGGYLYFGGAANQPTGSPKPTPVPGQLFQSTNSGASWTQITNFTPVVNVGPTAIAPNNGNVVAVVDGGSQVYLSLNALGGSPTFTNITRNLPGRAVTRLAFDPNDPTTLYAVMSGFNDVKGGHVFVTSTAPGSQWTDISPPLNVPFDGLALDGASSPTTIYAGSDLGVVRSIDGGNTWSTLDAIHFPNAPVTDLRIDSAAGVLRASTFGRGVFDFAAASGPVITVNPQNNLAFGNVCVSSSATLDLQIINTGTTDLIVNSVAVLAGSKDFSVLSGPQTPVTVSPNATVDFTIQFSPTAAGAESATIRISSNDPNAPTVDLTATGTGTQPAINTIIASGGNFGNVCVGSQSELNLTIANPSACPLRVSGITSSPDSTDFQVAAVVSYPLVVQPNGGSVQVPIQFDPQSIGAKSSNIFVSSNANPGAPAVPVSGNAPPGQIDVSGSGGFGDVCAGAGAQRTITVADVGLCTLHVLSASINCADFTIEGNPFPAPISADASLPLTIQFTPTSGGAKSCTLTIVSDDPAHPTVTLPLTADTPAVNIDVPPDQNFPATVVQSVGACNASNPFPVSNNGTCPLTISSVAIGGPDAADYSQSGLPSLPTSIPAGGILGQGNLDNVFKPTRITRAENGTVTVTYEDDPITHHTTPVVRNLCGEGTSRGARVLVTAGGVPLATVDKIQLHRLNSNRKAISIDNVNNATLQTVTQTAPCASFKFHREWGGVSNPIQLTAGDYQVTVNATVNGKKASKTVSFTLGTCSFNQNVVVAF